MTAADDDHCPICGQPYDFKRKHEDGKIRSLRDDATQCFVRTKGVGPNTDITTYYVHLDSDELSLGVDWDHDLSDEELPASLRRSRKHRPDDEEVGSDDRC